MRGVSLIAANRLADSRGSFTKILKFEDLVNIPEFHLEEVFVSKSIKGALRGMHIQVNEASNWRIIQVLTGKAFDVLLDLRPDEPTYKSIQENILHDSNPQILIIPPGVAHGFQAMEDTEMLYLTSHRYVPELDMGVNPLSIGIKWPLEITAMSDRDKALSDMKDF